MHEVGVGTPRWLIGKSYAFPAQEKRLRRKTR